MKRIPCTSCDETFKNQSGLSWHYSHIHVETSLANSAQDGQSVTMASESISTELEGPATDSEYIASENRASPSELDSRVDTLEGAVRELNDVHLQARSRLDKAEPELKQQIEATTGIYSEISLLREQVDSLCRLVWTLVNGQIEPALFPDFTTKRPTKEEIKLAKVVLRRVLGLDPAYVISLQAQNQRTLVQNR